MPTPIDFHRWVNDHNPPEKSEYRKGWWDYVEIVQRLMARVFSRPDEEEIIHLPDFLMLSQYRNCRECRYAGAQSESGNRAGRKASKLSVEFT